MDKLTNLHEALHAAVQETDADGKEVITVSFKLREDYKDEVQEICSRHGTTISEYLRQCCLGLIKDYHS